MTKMALVGPLLHRKNSPGRTGFAWVGSFLSNKMGPTRTKFDGQKRSGGPILTDKSGPGGHFWVGPFLP